MDKMTENSKIKTLSIKQHEFLEWLCRFRHELHCNQTSLFYSENVKYKENWEDIRNISNKATEVGLELRGYDEDTGIELDTDDILYETTLRGEDNQEVRESILEEAELKTIKFAEGINSDIERFLYEIDKKHNTNYCPSGFTRIY